MIKVRSLIFFFTFLGMNAGAFEMTPELASTGLKTVVINTIGGEEPVCESIEAPSGSWGVGITNVNKVPGSVTVYAPDGSVAYESGEYVKKESGMTIKVRGNTSARYAKKPFKIKLEKKGDLLCRGDKNLNDKNWVLLTARHNLYELGFLIGKWIGMNWSPEYEYVNVVLNDDFRGVYLLAEAVERNDKCRIITDETGFVVERDPYWWNENGEYLSSCWSPQFNWTMKYPDFADLTDEVKGYITDVLGDFEAIINTENYEQLIDIDSFCKWLIAQDILGTSDGGGTNFYLSKKDNTGSSKLYIPVLWDVDSGEETVDAWSAVHNEKMISPLFNNSNTLFRSRYIELYKTLSPTVWQNIASFTASLKGDQWEGYDKAAALNNERWGETEAAAQYSAVRNAEDMDWWFPGRKVWLDNAVDKLERDLEATGISEVEGDNFIIVYSLDGLKIYEGSKEGFHSATNGIYLFKSGNRIQKIICR